MTTPAPSLVARDVRVRLGERRVLDGVDLTLRTGEVTAIAGPNGAGKSTLLRVLAGLVPVQSGHVHLDGAPLASLDRRSLGRKLAYLPQERTIHWPVNVETVVSLGRLPHRGPAAAESDDDRASIARAMAAMDVSEFSKRSVAELSGGERARVLLARALAQGAGLLLADEPTSGLDPAHALAMFAHFRKLAGDGHGIAVALHDLSYAARFADRLVLLKQGRVVAQGLVRDVLTETNLAAVYAVRMSIGQVAGLPVVLAHDPWP